MSFIVQTDGHYDFIEISSNVQDEIDKSGLKNGVAMVFVAGSTAAITTMEVEDGVKKDIKNVLEKFAPELADYEHHKKWNDGNGAAHIKAAIFGPNICVPITEGKLCLGKWQEIVLIDFDEKAREREIFIKILKAADYEEKM